MPGPVTKVLSACALLLLIAFPLGMLFVGFADLEISCSRQHPGRLPNCEIREARWFGLHERRAMVLNVAEVGYHTRDVNTSSRVTLASTVYFYGSNGSIPVSRALSNVGTGWKSDVISKVRDFLSKSNEPVLYMRVRERNLFGWLGAASGAFILVSCLVWLARKLSRRG